LFVASVNPNKVGAASHTVTGDAAVDVQSGRCRGVTKSRGLDSDRTPRHQSGVTPGIILGAVAAPARRNLDAQDVGGTSGDTS
jgi:hypothetical protein